MDSTTLQTTEQATPIVRLTGAQARRLCEKIAGSIRNLGEMLWELKEKQGWVALGYASWDECCKTEFKYSQNYANRLIRAEKIQETVPIGTNLPESHLRELARVPEQARARVLEIAKEDAGDGPVTAEIIRNAADGLFHRCPHLAADEQPDGAAGVAADDGQQDEDQHAEHDEDRAAGDGEDVAAGVAAGEEDTLAHIPMMGRGVGLWRGNEAIDALKRIPRNDPFRDRGFQIVGDWVKAYSGANGQADDLEPLIRAWMQRTNKSATVAAIILEGIAAKLRAEEGGQTA